MRPLLLLTILLGSQPLTTLPWSHPPAQDAKVATWSAGTSETDNYESFAFWIKDDKRAYIRYLHGKDADDVELSWLGPDSVGNHRGFRAGFPAPDNRTLFIAPVGDSLLVLFPPGQQSKKFHWENENGQGDSAASCNICAQSAKQATGWLYQYFWK